ncbi:MAG: DUF177 domain-containing protein [Lachnospiraceae bacterium]|nr:DUF177 domain-containing protein [Lachnospiraceae bacterium]
MKIDLFDVLSNPGKSLSENGVFADDSISYNGTSYPITDKKPFKIHLQNEDGKRLSIDGDMTIKITAPCDRCLKDVELSMAVSVSRVLDVDEGHVIPDQDEEDDFFLEDNILDTDHLFLSEIYPILPTKVLCKDDCKGICPVCGKDRNVEDCGCDTTVLDPRMAQFLDVFKEAKEV